MRCFLPVVCRVRSCSPARQNLPVKDPGVRCQQLALLQPSVGHTGPAEGIQAGYQQDLLQNPLQKSMRTTPREEKRERSFFTRNLFPYFHLPGNWQEVNKFTSPRCLSTSEKPRARSATLQPRLKAALSGTGVSVPWYKQQPVVPPAFCPGALQPQSGLP